MCEPGACFWGAVPSWLRGAGPCPGAWGHLAPDPEQQRGCLSSLQEVVRCLCGLWALPTTPGCY